MEFPGGNDNYLAISGEGHHFLSSSETFHTPSLGDEEFEIPPISLDPDADASLGSGFVDVPGNAVVGANDPTFASAFVSAPPPLSIMGQQGDGPMLGATLTMDLAHPISSQFSSSSPMTIDVPLTDMTHGLLGHNPLTTIDQSELSAQLGLSLGGGAILPHPQSPDPPLSNASSPSDSLQDDDMDDFRQSSVLLDSPVSLSSSSSLLSLSGPCDPRSVPSSSPSVRKSAGVRKGRRRKDPREPQKPVSAYALFFRDTQAAIKGQNPSASFGEVSKIVASMWDSLGDEQKQVYKRKTEAAKKEYLKALVAYKADQLSQQPSIEVLDVPPSPPPAAVIVVPPPEAPPPAPLRSSRIPVHAPNNNTITNICTSNIILDLPQVSTRSRTGAHKAPPPEPHKAPPSDLPPIGKIIISKQQLQSPRQPPPLQQMQATPPPPRLQQAPPPLQAKPRGAAANQVVAMAPPPLTIKIVPATTKTDLSATIMVTNETPSPVEETLSPTATEEGMEVELNVSPAPEASPSSAPGVCVRAGCTNPPIESTDWDREYCSNECVATHCRDVFMAWCAIRQNSTTVT